MPIAGKVLIGLLTKNCDKWIDKVLANVELYAAEFESYYCLVVDGYSNDNTEVIIREWCMKDDKNRDFKYQPRDKTSREFSVNEARNFTLDTFDSMFQFNNDVYLLLLDADSPNASDFDKNGFLKAFDKKAPKWSALFPNQKKAYYDLYALRDNELTENYQMKFKDKKWGGEMEECLKPFNKPKTAENGFYPVKSAFGGAGLYRTSDIKNARYNFVEEWRDPTNNKKYYVPTCEHVPFNTQIYNNGGLLFINCNWYIGEHD
jgi:glycosyltransferase involved in cell wall biosynthesis